MYPISELERYGTEEMHDLWSIQTKYTFWLSVWKMIAQAQARCTTVSRVDFKTLVTELEQVGELNMSRIQEIEKRTQHELVAVQRYIEVQWLTVNLLHFGCTSSDIQDNTDAIRVHMSQQRILKALKKFMLSLNTFVYKNANVVCIGQTHLQPAEPTTMGYRFSTLLEEILNRWQHVPPVLAKGLTGAVGTATIFEMLQPTTPIPAMFESILQNKYPGIAFGKTSSQTALRFAEYDILEWLAKIAMACSRFAYNIRILHSQGEVIEGFYETRVGSSAMPHKHNPIKSENVCGLARIIKSNVDAYWNTAATQILERTLDDSSVRRVVLPLTFGLAEEMLIKCQNIVDNLKVDKDTVHARMQQPQSSHTLSAALLASPQTARSTLHDTVKYNGNAPSPVKSVIQRIRELYEEVNHEQ